MVDKLLIRPYFWGSTFLGGYRLASHNDLGNFMTIFEGNVSSTPTSKVSSVGDPISLVQEVFNLNPGYTFEKLTAGYPK